MKLIMLLAALAGVVIGRALLYTSAAIALLGTQLISVWWFGDYRFRAEVRDLVVVLLILTLLYRILVLFRIQQSARRVSESDSTKEV